MEDDNQAAGGGQQGHRAGGFLGSLKDALVAASRDDTAPAAKVAASAAGGPVMAVKADPNATHLIRREGGGTPNAAEAAREARGGGPAAQELLEAEADGPPTTRVVRGSNIAGSGDKNKEQAGPRTTIVRGKNEVKRGNFEVDPVVGWLVVVGGPGLGQFRSIFEGNNTLGRSRSSRIPIDFGDDAISSDEQAYIRYDSAERSFLFVPNLAKTNVVSVNEKRPTGAIELNSMDVITMGKTQLVFVAFCGAEFDWSALADKG